MEGLDAAIGTAVEKVADRKSEEIEGIDFVLVEHGTAEEGTLTLEEAAVLHDFCWYSGRRRICYYSLSILTLMFKIISTESLIGTIKVEI